MVKYGDEMYGRMPWRFVPSMGILSSKDGRVHQRDATLIQREQATAMVDCLIKWSYMEGDCTENTLSHEALKIPLLLVRIQLVTS